MKKRNLKPQSRKKLQINDTLLVGKMKTMLM